MSGIDLLGIHSDKLIELARRIDAELDMRRNTPIPTDAELEHVKDAYIAACQYGEHALYRRALYNVRQGGDDE